MGPGRDRTRDPGSAVRLASVAIHVTNCAVRPGLITFVNRLESQTIPIQLLDLIWTLSDAKPERIFF